MKHAKTSLVTSALLCTATVFSQMQIAHQRLGESSGYASCTRSDDIFIQTSLDSLRSLQIKAASRSSHRLPLVELFAIVAFTGLVSSTAMERLRALAIGIALSLAVSVRALTPATPTPTDPLTPNWKRCVEVTGVERRLEALPGTGWDNLENKDMGLIIDQSYDQCKTTNDGKFLIPDGVHAIPLQRSQVSEFCKFSMARQTNCLSSIFVSCLC